MREVRVASVAPVITSSLLVATRGRRELSLAGRLDVTYDENISLVISVIGCVHDCTTIYKEAVITI